jgi:hypothetical protein
MQAQMIAAPQQWEYLQYTGKHMLKSADDIEFLSDAGRHGWELVAVSTIERKRGYALRYTFKRPIMREPAHD